jgi:hypothetical protein
VTKQPELKQEDLLALLKSIFLLSNDEEHKEATASFSMQRIASKILMPSKPLTLKCKWSPNHSWCAVKYKTEKEYLAARPLLREAKNTLDALYGTPVEFSIEYTQKIKVMK